MRDKQPNATTMAEDMENDLDLEIDQDSDSGMMEVEHEESHNESAQEIERMLRETDISDIPATLIVTNVDVSVFENDNSKIEFEKTFQVYDENVTFQYFKSFRRARVNYSSPLFSTNAKIDLHEACVCGQRIKCFFFQPLCVSKEGDDGHLQPPPLDKQFLISPPSSPPVDWEQIVEHKPHINYDILAAIASLQPGETHELHPPSKDQPGIVVHVCEDPEGYRGGVKPKIVQTKCPDRST